MNDGSGNSTDPKRNLFYTSSGLIDAQSNPERAGSGGRPGWTGQSDSAISPGATSRG